MKGLFTYSQKRDGFTLLELLLAIAIFATVISMVYGAYNGTFKIINNAESQAKYGTRARVTLERIVEDLESFHLGSGSMLKGETSSVGEYRADSMSFTSNAHLVFNKDELPVGYATISFSIDEDEDNNLIRLYRADEPYRPGTTPSDDKGFLLCDGLKEVSFTYFDKDGNETESWDSIQSQGNVGGAPLPAMIAIKIGFASEEAEDAIVYYSTAVAISY